MLEIDGAMGEGGGQILRTALALSMCLAKPFIIKNIRVTRKRPGLRPQHLAAVKAAATISQAGVDGAVVGSQQLTFQPQSITPGHYDFSIGTAGSTSLVLQTLLPALMLADAPSTLCLQGGTHNPLAPSFDFLQQAFLPLINQMGPSVMATLERPGFFPKGGGKLRVNIHPVSRLKPLSLLERGELLQLRAEILLAHLPEHIAERERGVMNRELAMHNDQVSIRIEDSAFGPGNVVTVIVDCEHITEVFTAFGQRGVPAETVATRVAGMAKHYLHTGVPVGSFLADQLLLPLALADSGAFITCQPSLHTRTNIAIIELFMGGGFTVHEDEPDVWRIDFDGRLSSNKPTKNDS